MSLKAKIEAVIYASEEPVTLAQLTGLLGLEGQAELDALASQQQSLALEDEATTDAAAEPTNDADALNAEVLEDSPEESPVESFDDIHPANPASDSPTELGAPGPDSRTREESSPQPDSPTTPSDPKVAAAETKLRERRLRDYFRSLLDQLIADYANGDRGLEIREVANGFRLATKPEYHDAVRGFVKSLKPPLKLSLQALETLAVVAYKQPVTAPEVSEIRGVDSAGVLGSLMTRKLVTTAGRKQVIGRPILYKTTKDFLLRFGLKDIAELPSIEEFEKMAGELNETLLDQTPDQTPDTPDQETPMPTPADGSAPLDENAAVPQPTHIHHDTAEDLMSDHSTSPEGYKHEPAHHSAEPIAAIHSDQADGIPEDPDAPKDTDAPEAPDAPKDPGDTE